MPKYTDGEVIGVDTDGCLIQWDGIKEESYNSGETLEQFGEGNLTGEELKRVKK